MQKIASMKLCRMRHVNYCFPACLETFSLLWAFFPDPVRCMLTADVVVGRANSTCSVRINGETVSVREYVQ